MSKMLPKELRENAANILAFEKSAREIVGSSVVSSLNELAGHKKSLFALGMPTFKGGRWFGLVGERVFVSAQVAGHDNYIINYPLLKRRDPLARVLMLSEFKKVATLCVAVTPLDIVTSFECGKLFGYYLAGDSVVPDCAVAREYKGSKNSEDCLKSLAANLSTWTEKKSLILKKTKPGETPKQTLQRIVHSM